MKKLSPKNKPVRSGRGMTIIEIVVTMLIVSVLVATAIMAISGTLPRYRLSRGIRQIFTKMLVAKSKAVSLNRTYRFYCIDEKTFKIQYDDSGTWTDDGAVETLPTDIELVLSPTDYVANCAQNLQFTSRGILDILNGAQTEPFIELVNTQTNETKTVDVNVGGNIKVGN